ncbi:hypothetical protein [Rhizobium sp. BK068]|uniref:hypothetical protein n=1 Tax=Rhizobium sp. BK068 TaxID=2512130 RepID=UPI00104DA3A8|nr:hypothetical protein [Rhizobium sp. BK068]
MTITETPFRKAVADLKSPSSAVYSQADWDLAYESASPSVADTRLYEAARWIAQEFAKGRAVFHSPSFGPLSPEWATILAIASLNREYRTALQLKDDLVKSMGKGSMVAMDAYSGLRIKGPNGQHFTVEDLAESSTDLTENWLFDALNAAAADPPPSELSGFAFRAGKSYSFRKALNTLWNQAWHEGWYYEIGADGTSAWRPGDPAAMILNQTWLQRQQTNLMGYPFIDLSVWPKLSQSHRRKFSRQRAVTAVKRVGRSVKLRVSSPSYLSRRPPAYTLEKSAIEGSYLSDFFETEMPNAKGITAAILHLAWHLITDIAEGLTREVKLPSCLSPDDARALALAVPAAALIDAIGEGLEVDTIMATAVVDFLTFAIKSGKNQKGNRGLWSAPLVRVPNCDEYLLPLPALQTSNPVRKVEAWLEKGGIDDTNPITARGEKYEAIYRARLSEDIRTNKKFTTASVAEHGIKKTRDFNEQVDLLVAFGGLCLVGEIKLFLMPTDPSERARYDKKLESAATQAKRKLDLLKKRPDVVAAALGITASEAERLRYLPVVVTAQDYGFSTRVSDVLIVEAGFLSMFLGGTDIVVGRVIQKGSTRTADRKIEYYKSEAMAAQRFEKEASAPYVLKRISDRYTWATSPYPTLAHARATLAVPVFNDIDGVEKERAQSMIATLSNRRTAT